MAPKTDQTPVIVDQEFIERAIIEKIERMGLWNVGRPAFCHIEGAIDASKLSPERRELLSRLTEAIGVSFPIRFHAELRPEYGAEELLT